MARDGRLPFGNAIARVSGRRKVPIVPALVTGIITLGILALNIANQSAFVALTGVAIIMFYLCYLGCTGPMLRAADQGHVAEARPRAVLLARALGHCWSTLAAVIYGAVVAFDIAWPRAIVYGAPWYFKWAPYEFIGATVVLGAIWYFTVYARKPIEVIEAHRADRAVRARRRRRTWARWRRDAA